jgi:putative peptidoglycan lipid II flippase
MKLNLALGWLAATNLLLGLLIQWYVVTRLGVGMATDALYAGMAVPQLVLAVVGGSLGHVLVPLLANEDPEHFNRTAWGFFLGVAAVFAVFAAVLFASAPFWVRWLLPGFDSGALELTVRLTRIQLLSIVFTAGASVLSSAHYARHRFLWTDASPVIAGVIAFAVLVAVLPRFGIVAAAWSGVLRAGLPILFLLPGIGGWRAGHGDAMAFRTAWRRIRPLLVGTAYYKTDPLVDRFLSSMAPAGGLSLLVIGQQVWAAASQVVNKAITSPMVPRLAVQAARGDWPVFERMVRKRLRWMAALTVGGFVIFLAAGKRLLHLLIGHGGVTGQNVEELWLLMAGLGGVLIAGALGQITSTSYYAAGDTRTPTRFGIITFTFYVPLKVLAFLKFGLMGVAVATSLFTILNMALQLAFMKKVLRPQMAVAR